MFICSICDETFCEVPTYSTLCGHVFHSECILKWLKRKQNCPQCRATVFQKDLIKLFLEDNPNVCIPQNNTDGEELNTLKNQLRNAIKDKKSSENLITQLENQLKKLNENAINDFKSIILLKANCQIKEKTIDELGVQLARIHIDHKNLKELHIFSERQYQLEQIKNISLEKDLHEIQSVNSIVIDKLNSEIADLKSEKAYLQDKCHSLEKQIEQPSTPKVQIEYDYALSHDDKIQNTFYGHDPKLKLSSKKFLLGCVFLFIEDRNQFEDICSDIFMLKLNIVEYGGSFELSYSTRVTHLICVTQKHHLVGQGLKDGKRCVTDYWLNDTIAKKCLLPPWLAYHFPLPYSDENNLPCQQLQIAITNFEQNEYHIVCAMVKLTGAHIVNLISSNTDVVVSKNLCGDMINTAFALKKPVVNVQWLNDILFGAINGIKNPESIKYQQFNSIDPFLVNYDMVSHLMEAWKYPVVFLQNNEVYDLTESSAGPSMCKRQKKNSIENEIIDIDDDECSNDVIITYVSVNLPKKPCILFCGFETEVEEELKQIVVELGGKVATHCDEGTHLVMNKPFLTLQFLSCLTTISHIVGEHWIRISRLLHKFHDEKEYYINEIYDNIDGVNSKVICNVQKVLQNSERQKLFEHMIFHITPGIEFPPSDCLEHIIKSAGGTIEKEIKNMFKELTPATYFIITCFEDLHLIKEVLGMDPILYKPNFITNAIMQQCISVNQNHLLTLS